MQRILVTGANKGIGLAIVEAILSSEKHPDCYVFLGARSLEKGQEAFDRITAKYPNFRDRLEVVQLDVTDESTILDAAAKLSSTGKLYAVVNNAGVLSQNLDDLLNTNYYGVKKVSEAFLPHIDQFNGRIVNISSGAGPMFVTKCSTEKSALLRSDNVNLDQINNLIDEFRLAYSSEGDHRSACESAGFGTGDQEFFAYGFSKALVNAYTIYLAKLHPTLKINSCTPGMIKTDLFIPLAQKAGKTLDELSDAFGALPVEKSTISTMRLLFDESISSGCYFGSDGLRSPMGVYRKPGSPEYTGEDGN